MGRDPDAVYRYVDLEDRTVFEVLRYRDDTGRKTFRQRRPTDNGWTWNLDGVKRIPYRLPFLDWHIDERPDEPIYVVEGEKDVETLTELGLTATTSAAGANWVWPDDWARWFDGARTVVVIADNDDPGRAAAHQRAAVIAKTVTDVRVIDELPGVAEHGDVSDWLANGHGLDDLDQVVAGAPFWAPPAPPEPDTLAIRWVADIEAHPAPEPPVLIDGFLRKGELSVVVAARAVGKSWFTYNLATLLDRGEGKFLGRLDVRQQARTLIAQGELDPWGAESRWRFLTGDQLPSRVAESFDMWAIHIEKMRTTERDDTTGMTWTSEAYVAKVTDRLESTIVTHGVDLLVIDPWAVFYDGEENSKREVQAALDVLRGISLRTGAAILIVHHISKVTDFREPEDLWRGSSRLADWASTRVTLMPHFRKEADWAKKGLTRHEARRIADVHFLRRNGGGDEFTIQWDPRTGWWDQRVLKAEEAIREAGENRRYNPVDVAAACRDAGGYWPSKRAAAEALKVSPSVVGKYLEAAVSAALLEPCAGETPQGRGYRVPAATLLDEPDPPTLTQQEAEALAADADLEEY